MPCTCRAHAVLSHLREAADSAASRAAQRRVAAVVAGTGGDARVAVLVEVVAEIVASAGPLLSHKGRSCRCVCGCSPSSTHVGHGYGTLLHGAHHADAGRPLCAARAAVRAARHHEPGVCLALAISCPSSAVGGPLVLAALFGVDEPSKLELPSRVGWLITARVHALGGEHGGD